MNPDTYKALKLELNSRILTITLNRPEARNAINDALHNELARVFHEVDVDPDVDIVILTGAGEAFCAGGDLKWLLDVQETPELSTSLIRKDRRIQNDLLDMEKPIIAKVRGPAIGLGCSLALFCDFVYATPDAIFADPHVSIGLVAGDGGAVIWPQLIGYARAKRYLLTGDRIDGAEAERLGLITRAVAADELDGAVQAMAERLAGGATHAIRWTKASINAGLKVTANAIIDRAAAYENVSILLTEHQAALEAFQKRKKGPAKDGDR